MAGSWRLYRGACEHTYTHPPIPLGNTAVLHSHNGWEMGYFLRPGWMSKVTLWYGCRKACCISLVKHKTDIWRTKKWLDCDDISQSAAVILFKLEMLLECVAVDIFNIYISEPRAMETFQDRHPILFQFKMTFRIFGITETSFLTNSCSMAQRLTDTSLNQV